MNISYSDTHENEERFIDRDIFSDKFQADYDYNGELPADCDPADCRRNKRGAAAYA